MNKKLLPLTAIGVIMCVSLITGVPNVFAAAYDWIQPCRNPDDTADSATQITGLVNNHYAVSGTRYGGNCTTSWYYLGDSFMIAPAGDTLGSNNYIVSLNPASLNVFDLAGGLPDIIDGKASTTSVNTLSSSVASIQSIINTINANLYGTSTNMTVANASTTNGLMSKADKTKLDALSVPATRVFATSTRSIVTGTGATGFQVSNSQDVMVNYAVNIVTTATIGGASAGYVTLEIAPTNSATSTDWYEIGSRCRNDQTITLAVALQSVQSIGCTLSGAIPTGYYVKLRSVNVSGTPTYSYISGQEVKF